jgi:hypothetical protein
LGSGPDSGRSLTAEDIQSPDQDNGKGGIIENPVDPSSAHAL